jgi:type VI secretion system secreted protein Hcp
MGVEAFLKLPNVTGESVVKGFEKQLHVKHIQWGAVNRASSQIGTGSGSGKVDPSDIHILREVDAASPTLYQACVSGTHYDSATIAMRKQGGSDALVYFQWDFQNVIITSISWSAGDGDEERVHETLSLNFGILKVTYQAQDNKGAKSGGPVTTGWDFRVHNKL